MTSVIFQGLRSSDFQITDTRTLSLKFAFLAQNKPNSEEIINPPSNPNLGTWNFLQSLSNSSQFHKEKIPYAHQPILTGKSLELCTENLGNETGSYAVESAGLSLSPAGNSEISARGKRKPNSRQVTESGKLDFPPPLTTMSGSDSVRVQTHRESGRLIVEAVVGAPFENSSSCFRAERSHGRLRLCFLKECCNSDFAPEMDSQEDEAGEYVGGNDLDAEDKMGMEKFQRPSWCKVGRPNLLSRISGVPVS